MKKNSQHLTSLSSTASVAAAGPHSINRTLTKSPSTSSMNIPSIFSSQQNATGGKMHQTSLSTPSTPTSSSYASSLLTTSSFLSSQQSNLTIQRSDSNTSLSSTSTNATTTNSNIANNQACRDFAKFFDKNLPLHRLLYHLEALSSRIIPARSNLIALESPELFQ